MIVFSKKEPPIGAVLTCNAAKVSYEWGGDTRYVLEDDVSLTTSHAISRHIARVNPDLQLYPSHILQRTQVDHWLSIASNISNGGNLKKLLAFLNTALATSQRLVPPQTTVADYEVFGALYQNREWLGLIKSGKAPEHCLRWYNSMIKLVSSSLNKLPKEVKSAIDALGEKVSTSESTGPSTKREDGGKFVELPGAEMGKVVVRFPPEASGYLHIGHAKAALLNQHYQQAFKGQLIMRFDDTNPAKEDAHFEEVILSDLKMLQVKPDRFTHTSDYFDLMMELCEKLMKKDLAYVDDTDAETMKAERDERKDSRNRGNSLEKNMKMWGEMKQGTTLGQKCAVRAKIDMTSNNGCMRDPTIYRCKPEEHVRTGTKYKVYPTYDFACPIVDSIEGVTHALRTTEYHDRDDQFEWFIEKLELRPVHIYEYSRLNMNNTVLSKRKLTWFVNEGHVDGWDDPRFPTVRGIMRRGMTVEGLKDFIIAQGSSRSVVNMEWDKIWSFNKKVIDASAPRFTALEEGKLIPVNVTDAKESSTTAQKHPKDPSIGTKTVWMGSKVFIESADAEVLKEGENATFINWGNLTIKKVHKENGTVKSVDAVTNLTNSDYKKTLKLTWLVDNESKSPLTPVVATYYDHLISKGVLGKDEDFKNFLNVPNVHQVAMLGDDELKGMKEGEIIQLQRKGFFRVDKAYSKLSVSSCKEGAIMLIHIPDGHSKENIFATMTGKADADAKTKVQPAKGKKTEKSPAPESKAGVSDSSIESIHELIKSQGDKIRSLKSGGADKSVIMTEVTVLKDLKTKFKSASGVEWKPEIDMSQFKSSAATASATTSSSSSGSPQDLHQQVVDQGSQVRSLKSSKASKEEITAAVGKLLALKGSFKEATGVDWKPDIDMSQFKENVQPTSTTGGSGAMDIHNKIVEQGNKVRTLKSSKASKDEIKGAVDLLLQSKKEFKDLTGLDWKPDIDTSKFASSSSTSASEKPAPAKSTPTSGSCGAMDIHNKIVEQGNKVRDLKSSKASKDDIKAAVDVLLSLKKEFKELANLDWKPDIDTTKFASSSTSAPEKPSAPSSGSCGAMDIHNKIVEQGNKVRDLKSSKASKDDIKAAVDVLLSLKKEFKELTNLDWKPDIDTNKFASSSTPSSSSSSSVSDIHDKIVAQGTKVRTMKSSGASKPEIKAAVDTLLALKAEFKEAANVDWKPDIDISSLSSSAPSKPAPKVEKVVQAKKAATKVDADSKKQTRLGLESTKEENLSEWYSQVITKSEMIEYYNVSGCYILRPWSYTIWEKIRDFIDAEIKKIGVENCSFPMFVSKDALEKEKTHIADFSPEVAWVTKSGSSDLAEPIAIRPTSETVMYPAYAKWIKSHRDLPLCLNQWNSVVRWEFKQPTPFLRTREFLWQEGHSAFATRSEATDEVYKILEIYAGVYEQLLAIPVVRGKKTEKEKFAGGDFTTTTEAFVSASGRGVQGATSHHLGQNFSKMFNIQFEDQNSKKEFVYQNSWGLSTRTIGVMVMIHGDNKGLILPPRVARLQAVIMPVGVTVKVAESDKNKLYAECNAIKDELKKVGVRCDSDLRDHVTPAWKFNDWELKGVPLRIELGPREVQKGEICIVRRDNGEKSSMKRCDISKGIPALLDAVHKFMYDRANTDLTNHIKTVTKWDDFGPALDGKNLMLVPFCGAVECEESIKKDSARDQDIEPGAPSMGAKSLCIPFQQPKALVPGAPCIHPSCKQAAKHYTLFGRSY